MAFTLDLYGDNLVNLAVGDAVIGSDAGVDQLGTIVADGGLVQISADVAEGVVDRVINMSGIVEADPSGRRADGLCWMADLLEKCKSAGI